MISKLNFIITPVTWSFRNHSNILICCNFFSLLLLCWKQLSRIFQISFMNRRKFRTAFIWNKKIFCNIINVFIITFDQFKASLLNKSINLYNFFPPPKIVNIDIIINTKNLSSKSAWFLKNHVTLRTGVSDAEKLYLLHYIIIILNSQTISQYYCFCCILDHINAGLGSRRAFFKNIKHFTVQNLFGSVHFMFILYATTIFLLKTNNYDPMLAICPYKSKIHRKMLEWILLFNVDFWHWISVKRFPANPGVKCHFSKDLLTSVLKCIYPCSTCSTE